MSYDSCSANGVINMAVSTSQGSGFGIGKTKVLSTIKKCIMEINVVKFEWS